MRTGITFSTFDLLHAGHILMLKEAKERCNYLIVGLQTDPSIDRPEKNKPVQMLYERFVQLQGCQYVDEIIPYTHETEILEILASRKPNVRIVGEDYKGKDFTGKNLCEHLGIEIFFNTRRHGFSTSELRKRIGNENNS